MTSRGRAWLIVAIVVLLLVAGGGIAWWFTQRGGAGTQVVPGGITLSVTKSASPTSATPGEPIAYTITWQADGGGFTGPGQVVDDYAEQSVTVSGISGGGTDNGSQLTWTIPPLDLTGGPAGGTFTYTGTLAASFPTLPATVSNTVTFSMLDPMASATAAANVTVTGGGRVGVPQLAIVKDVVDLNGGQVKRGDTLQYTVTVTNVGTADAPNLRVQDNVGPFLEQFTVTATPPKSTNASQPPPAGTNQTGTVDVSGFTLTPQAAGVVSYSAVVAANAPDGQSIPNVAVGSCDGCAPVQDDASVVVAVGSVTPTGQAAPTLTIVKNVVDTNGGVVERGDTLRYTITVGNTGTGAATGVHVHDNVGQYLDSFAVVTTPAGSFDASAPTGGTNGTGYLDVHQFNLAPAAQATVEYTVVVASAAPDGTPIANVAVGSCPTCTSVQDDANVAVSVPAPDIVVPPATGAVEPTGASVPLAQPVLEQPVVVEAPVTGIDPLVAIWLAIGGALAAVVVGYGVAAAFKVLR